MRRQLLLGLMASLAAAAPSPGTAAPAGRASAAGTESIASSLIATRDGLVLLDPELERQEGA